MKNGQTEKLLVAAATVVAAAVATATDDNVAIGTVPSYCDLNEAQHTQSRDCTYSGHVCVRSHLERSH